MKIEPEIKEKEKEPDKLAKKDHIMSYFNRFREIFIYKKFKKDNILVKGVYYE